MQQNMNGEFQIRMASYINLQKMKDREECLYSVFCLGFSRA